MKTIAIIGVDGAGKSTLIESIYASYEERYEIKYYHLRPFFKFGAKEETEAKLGGSAPNPHSQEPRSAISSALKVSYYFCDYWLGYWRDRKIANSNNILRIFDRYFLDLANDPIRYRLKSVTWLVHFLYRFLPKSDVCILVSGTPEILWERKKEISLEETVKQVARLEKLAQKYNWVILRNDDSIETSKAELNEILEAFIK